MSSEKALNSRFKAFVLQMERFIFIVTCGQYKE